MILIITTKKIQSKIATVTNTFSNIDWSDVDSLIYHESIEELSSKSSSQSLDLSEKSNELSEKSNDLWTQVLSTLPDTVKKRIYIKDKEFLNPLVYTLFKGQDGVILLTENALESDSSLDYLLDNYKNTGFELDVNKNDITELETVFNLACAGEDLSNQNMKASIEESLDMLKVVFDVQSAANVDIVSAFGKYSTIFQTLTKRLLTSLDSLSKAEAMIAQLQSVQKSPNITFFPVCDVPVYDKKVYYIKCFGDVQGLVSLYTYYVMYINANTNLHNKARLLLLLPQNHLYDLRYSSFFKLSRYTKPEEIADIKHFYTTEPISSTLQTFFGLSTDICFVIDLTSSDTKCLLKSHENIQLHYAFASVGLYRRLYMSKDLSVNYISTIPKKSLIFSKLGVTGSFIIPYVDNFCVNEEDTFVRQQFFLKNCKKAYNELDKQLQLDAK